MIEACSPGQEKNRQPVSGLPEWPWEAPDTASIPFTAEGDLIRYGRSLIAKTAHYLGPEGIVRPISNGMNCQNCHLDAGTRPWGNNYSAVAATYPRYRDRSGTIESVEKRVNDCLQRSLNGSPLDSNSHELKAMVAYIKWVGSKVPANKKPLGVGISSLPYLDRPADSARGRLVYDQYCQRCHGTKGQGMPDSIGPGYRYPPLWGKNSYNTGAGIYRLSRLAGYVRDNMPYDEASHLKPVLSDEEAWDVAAFINTQARPLKAFPGDWPDIRTKPVDHPFGPFPDTFPEQQHKYGPFKPIGESKTKAKQ
ncbi:c-type cytochrome [Pseudoflavitalea sp. X16]|nr:c-type cytochrome [Paraflavitalea devenefica]